MISSTSSVEKQVKAFCARIGKDPLLVQGAGGNVSWKDNDVLWVKASGAWLAEAESKEIFVPVSLPSLRHAVARQKFSVEPKVSGESHLRPSIETLLHVLMPHRVVVHLHAVEILSHLVRASARQSIERFVTDAVRWIFVDYFKPGADLAVAVSEELKFRPNADVVFMDSHGLVIGGEDVNEVVATLKTLTSKLKTEILPLEPERAPTTRKLDFVSRGYVPFRDKDVDLLVLKEELIGRLRSEWALYPDHVVFLGSEAMILEKSFKERDLDQIAGYKPPFIFSLGDGVYQLLQLPEAQKMQMRCYFDVITRQSKNEMLKTLNHEEISDLLDWDAEKYRQKLTS